MGRPKKNPEGVAEDNAVGLAEENPPAAAAALPPLTRGGEKGPGEEREGP